MVWCSPRLKSTLSQLDSQEGNGTTVLSEIENIPYDIIPTSSQSILRQAVVRCGGQDTIQQVTNALTSVYPYPSARSVDLRDACACMPHSCTDARRNHCRVSPDIPDLSILGSGCGCAHGKHLPLFPLPGIQYDPGRSFLEHCHPGKPVDSRTDCARRSGGRYSGLSRNPQAERSSISIG